MRLRSSAFSAAPRDNSWRHRGQALDRDVVLTMSSDVAAARGAKARAARFAVRLESLGRVRCGFAQEIRREDEVLVKAKVSVASLATGSFKPAEIPEGLRKKMEAAL